MTKQLFLAFLLLIFGVALQAQETPQIPNSQGMDSLQKKVMKLMDFYESYDNGSSETQKKEKYNDAVDEISEGTASEPDKKDAFKIIDAYIKGDKALEQENTNQDTSEDFDDKLEQTEEVQQALGHMNQEKTRLLEMPYAEYEAYLESSNPLLTKREIKESYNQIHANDGRAVSISSSDDTLTDEQKKVQAFIKLENASTYEEYKEAIQILNPSVSEEEIRKAWDNR